MQLIRLHTLLYFHTLYLFLLSPSNVYTLLMHQRLQDWMCWAHLIMRSQRAELFWKNKNDIMFSCKTFILVLRSTELEHIIITYLTFCVGFHLSQGSSPLWGSSTGGCRIEIHRSPFCKTKLLSESDRQDWRAGWHSVTQRAHAWLLAYPHGIINLQGKEWKEEQRDTEKKSFGLVQALNCLIFQLNKWLKISAGCQRTQTLWSLSMYMPNWSSNVFWTKCTEWVYKLRLYMFMCISQNYLMNFDAILKEILNLGYTDQT